MFLRDSKASEPREPARKLFLASDASPRGRQLSLRKISGTVLSLVGHFRVAVNLVMKARLSKKAFHFWRSEVNKYVGAELSHANSSEKYIYIVEDVRVVSWQQCKQSMNDVRQKEGC